MKAVTPLPDDDEVEIYEGDLVAEDPTGFQGRASIVGQEFKHQAHDWLVSAGATFLRDAHSVGSYNVEGVIEGSNGQHFIVLAHGVLDDAKQAGLKRSDTVKKAGFDAYQIRRLRSLPILLITSHMPNAASTVARLLGDCAADIFDVFAINGALGDFHRLQRYLHDDPFPGQLPATWRDTQSHYEPELFDSADQPIPIQISYGAQIDDDYGPEEPF